MAEPSDGDPATGNDAGSVDAAPSPPAGSDASGSDASGSVDASASVDVVGRDAGVGTPPPDRDAAASTDAKAPTEQLPPWAVGIEGRYAFRTRLFGEESGIVLAGDAIGTVTIAKSAAGGLELTLRTCDAVTNTGLSSMRVTHPELQPTRVYLMEFSNQTWRANLGQPVGSGFNYEMPAACRGMEGRPVAKDPSQVWIRGDYCQCPLNLESEVKSDDCRVRDIDGDGQPGFRLDGSGAVSGVYAGAILFKHTFIDGLRRSDGSMTAFNEDKSAHFQLSGPSSRNYADSRPCAARLSPTEFIPIPADMACATLLAQRATLFRTPLPEPPARCQ